MIKDQLSQLVKVESMTNLKIGDIVSLVTNAEQRYEGTLVAVDSEKNTMSLKNVKAWGTEGRKNGEEEVAPNDKVLGSVKFKVHLIKAFYRHKS